MPEGATVSDAPFRFLVASNTHFLIRFLIAIATASSIPPLSFITMATTTKMPYRFLGNSGLLVSKLSLGSWMGRDEKYTADAWYEMMATAFKHGVNFFDNAESYGMGQAEENMGGAIQKGITDGVWSREDLVITTKLFNGCKGFFECGPNDQGLSRKHIVEGTKASLARLQLEYVDVIYCHRQDPYTPLEETVRAMNYVIQQGWAFYWGTSEWLAKDILEACEIADRLGLMRPVVEQSQYNIFVRNKVEYEYVDLYTKYKLGLTTWSPLAYGTLTGKYSAGKPEGSRFTADMFKAGPLTEGFEERVAMADKLKPIAEALGCSLAQMSIAWAAANDNVSTVMVGASRKSQLEDNLKALNFVSKITPDVKAKIDAIVNFVPTVPTIDQFASLRMRHL
ncbi:Voltage-gated potassium channel subunit beta-2 [Phytophthora ramorum]|nr:putative voltage-gated potassium channel subunit beta [Phytophthora ramorum]